MALSEYHNQKEMAMRRALAKLPLIGVLCVTAAATAGCTSGVGAIQPPSNSAPTSMEYPWLTPVDTVEV